VDYGSRSQPEAIASDGIPARRFPVVNVALIAATFLVWILYELPNLGSAVHQRRSTRAR